MATGCGLFVGWYDTDPAFQPELDQWHSDEHMPERVALPGFLTGQRYVSISNPRQYCVIYRADDVRAFVSAAYLHVLNNPTPWTRKMMPGVRNLNRTLCSVIRDTGGGFGRYLLTLQFSPIEASGDEILNRLSDQLASAVVAEPGLVRLTLASADKAISQTKTVEQDLRAQPNAISDSIILVEGYDVATIRRVANDGLPARNRSTKNGEELGVVSRIFELSHLLVSDRHG